MNANRDAIEYEKEAHASNLEQGEAMEKSMISMDYEIEKLRAELANVEKRARAAAAAVVAETPSPGYAARFRNLEIGYGGSSYPDVYAMHQDSEFPNLSMVTINDPPVESCRFEIMIGQYYGDTEGRFDSHLKIIVL
ncbi:hypothetical protein ACSBR1_023976 [Camellia fascicularis]